MSALVLDTNAYSRALRGDPAAVEPLRSASEIHIPLMVLGELLAGFAAGSRAERNRRDLAEFMSAPRVSLMRPDERTAHRYAGVVTALRESGRPIPTNDVWIAALALQAGMPLLTFDAHFGWVPGLSLARSR
ncbi:MAG TPA: type II toxin-antitoxin system VapC family toxin [Burkholderiales bacterium]|nr:type II toxin-antitoxin system VapC family toxin [Burkholderiales bacterium]